MMYDTFMWNWFKSILCGVLKYTVDISKLHSIQSMSNIHYIVGGLGKIEKQTNKQVINLNPLFNQQVMYIRN